LSGPQKKKVDQNWPMERWPNRSIFIRGVGHQKGSSEWQIFLEFVILWLLEQLEIHFLCLFLCFWGQGILLCMSWSTIWRPYWISRWPPWKLRTFCAFFNPTFVINFGNKVLGIYLSYMIHICTYVIKPQFHHNGVIQTKLQ